MQPLNPSGGRIAIVKNLALFTSFPEDVHSFLFDMPSGVGTDNEFCVVLDPAIVESPPGFELNLNHLHY